MPQNDNIIRKINLGSGEYDIESINSQIVDMQGLVINKTEQEVTSEDPRRTTIINRLKELDIKRPIVLYNLYREPEYEENNIDYTITSYQSIICRKSDGTYEQRLKIYNYRNKDITITACNGFLGTFTFTEPVGQNSTKELTIDITNQGNPRYVAGGTETDQCNITYNYTESGSTVTATMTNGYWAGYDYTANGTIAYAKASASDTKGQIEIIAPIDADKVMYVWADLSDNSTQPIKYQIKDIESSTLIKINMGMFTFKHIVRSSTSGLGSKIAKQLADPVVDKGNQILIYNFRMLDEGNQLNNVCLLNVAQEEYDENNELVSRELEGSIPFNQQLFSLRIKVVKDADSSTGWQISEYDVRALESSQINLRGYTINDLSIPSEITHINPDDSEQSYKKDIVNDFFRALKNNVNPSLSSSDELISPAPIGLYNFKINGAGLDWHYRSNYANLMFKENKVLESYWEHYIKSYPFYDDQNDINMYGLTTEGKYNITLKYEERLGPEEEYLKFTYSGEAASGVRKWRWQHNRLAWLDLANLKVNDSQDRYGFKYGEFTPSMEHRYADPVGLVSQNKGQANSYAYAKIKFSCIGSSTVTLKVYAGARVGDCVLFSKLDTDLIHGRDVDPQSSYSHIIEGGSEWGDLDFTYPGISAGDHYITIKYIKNSGSIIEDDIVAIQGISVFDYSHQRSYYIYTGRRSPIQGDIVESRTYLDGTEGHQDEIGRVVSYQDNTLTIRFTRPLLQERRHILATKDYIPDKYVSRVTETSTYQYRAYVALDNKETRCVSVAKDTPVINTIVQRDAFGRVITADPSPTVSGLHAVNVGYANTHYPMNPTTSAAYDRAYVIGAGSTQTYYYYRIEKEDKIAYSIAQRNSNGQLFVAAPTLEYHAVNKGYVDANFVPKLTTTAGSTRAFVQTSGGSISGITVTSNIEGNTSAIIVRDANNRAQINTPTVALDISNKGYVDDNLPRIIRG